MGSIIHVDSTKDMASVIATLAAEGHVVEVTPGPGLYYAWLIQIVG